MVKKSKDELVDLIAEATSEKVDELKKIIEKQRKQIDRLKDKKLDLIDAMNEAIQTNIAELDLRPVKPPTKSKKKTKHEEICVPLLSDIQLMYDGSTKQIQDIEVGDVVKSYQPIGMPDESEGISWESYTTTDLSGSFSSGSIVVETTNKQSYGYYLINGSIKVPAVPHTMHGGGKFFCKTGDTWSWKQSTDISVGDYFLNSDGSELEITSKTNVYLLFQQQ